ncbi:MAG TPA: aminotransferase class I/II-fold pyridoxal phosphate-dependent enzyme, partial [Kofleriaceae bacterium]|nr:aminotransferase class I/II-fold pyridoxal phosphate-dependent enzyme [Kofleriaceae bacterium]
MLEDRAAPLHSLLEQARAAGVYHFEEPIVALDSQWVHTQEGRRKLMFATYSYLGLLGHPAIAAASIAAVTHYGTGTHGVRLNGGTLDLHKRLERRIAEFLGREDALVFSSGFMTNQGVLTALLQPGDWVIGDQWNHASIVDGCRASGATFRVYPHNDLAALERLLLEAPPDVLRLVVVDALFSLDGDLVDLPRIVELVRRHHALLMVDEAHSLGALGERGRGIEDHFAMPGVIDLAMGTLSKVIPACGGYVAGSHRLV